MRPPGERRGHPWLTLIRVALGVIMVGLDRSVVAIANPAIAADLGASLSELQWITNANLLTLGVLLILAGKLGDRFGRRRIFLTGVVGFAIASAGIGVIGSILRVTFPADRLGAAGRAAAAQVWVRIVANRPRKPTSIVANMAPKTWSIVRCMASI